MQILEIFLGILTAMGGFVEVGELTFMLNAGSKFDYQLLWIDPHNSKRLLAGVDQGAVVSVDAGATWSSSVSARCTVPGS